MFVYTYRVVSLWISPLSGNGESRAWFQVLVETMDALHRRRGTVAAGLVLDFYEMPCCLAILLLCISSLRGTLFQFIVVSCEYLTSRHHCTLFCRVREDGFCFGALLYQYYELRTNKDVSWLHANTFQGITDEQGRFKFPTSTFQVSNKYVSRH